MLNVSAEWKRSVILDDNRQYLAYADVVLADGKKLSLDNTKFWNGGFSVNDSTSTQGTFTVGALVASKLTIKINNIYDDYSEYDFTDARVTAYIAKQLESGLEKIKIGEFTISSTSYDGSIITLTCLDNVNKFNKAYNSNLTYPATLYEIVRNACLDCGVPFTMARFPNSNYTVQAKPDTNNTYGRVIAYALQICGCFGKCDHNGTLTIGWYNLSLFSEKNYTGGTFSAKTTPYSDGDTLNGGTFAYTDGDSVDGGSYTDRQEYHNIYGSKEFKVDTDDVVITGVKVVVTSQESESKDVEYLSGKTGYVIAINNNPLVEADQAETVADFVYGRIGGMRFRPFSGSFLSDPTIESGDTAIVNDRKGNTYDTFISNRTFSLGNNTTISCDAESASRNSADKYTADTKAIVEARKTAQKQLSAYDTHMQLLTMLMAQSVGLFKTEQKQDDGSTIYIMHNKADLASSQIQWKMTANGMAVSSDYGKTWNAGVDSSGNAVFNVMSAIGINFDWAHGGTLTLGGENNVNGKQYVKDAKGKTLVTLDNKGITLDSSVKIAWDNVADTTTKVTQITKDTVTTEYVNALNIKAGSVDAENITGTTITGKNIVSGTINIGSGVFAVDKNGKVTASNMNITGGSIKISTSDKTFDTIALQYSTFKTALNPYYVQIESADGTLSMAAQGLSAHNSDSSKQARHADTGFYVYEQPSTGSYITVAYMDANGLYTIGNISCSGTKSRIASTENYNERLLYCYEMASPIFGDIGEGMVDKNGKCFVFLEDIFLETIDTTADYQVFLQKYGNGDCWIAERTPTYFVVEGTPNISFAWEIKAVQKEYDGYRTEKYGEKITENIDSENLLNNVIDDLLNESEE